MTIVKNGSVNSAGLLKLLYLPTIFKLIICGQVLRTKIDETVVVLGIKFDKIVVFVVDEWRKIFFKIEYIILNTRVIR